MVVNDIAEVFASVGARGRLHARALDSPFQLEWHADQPVVLSSVVKVLVVLEFARQAAAGQLDERDRVLITYADRLGGSGTAGCLDDVEMSLRDLARFAMALSDNTAADLLMHRVGLDTVQALVRELGLTSTRVLGGPKEMLATIVEDLGSRDAADFAAGFAGLDATEISRLSALDPARSTASTPRDLTRLLELVWRDEAGPPAACAMVRSLMDRQVSWQRFTAAFPGDVRVAAKSGSLPLLRQEIGVVSYPDRRRYAVAVFSIVDDVEMRRPDVEAAVGTAARLAVEHLRGQEGTAVPPR